MYVDAETGHVLPADVQLQVTVWELLVEYQQRELVTNCIRTCMHILTGTSY